MKRLRWAAGAGILTLLAGVGFWCWRVRDLQDPALRFDFVAYGDCRHNDAIHRRICDSILRTEPKYVVTTGDYVDHGEEEACWPSFGDITRALRAKAPYYAVIGDHDGDGSLLRKEFGLDRLYYDKVIGDIHFFFLDSRSGFRDADQVKWLEERAAASTARHKIAVFHHPPFVIHSPKETDAEDVRKNLHPILAKHRFCAAFCGHQHSFYTTVRDGVRYVVTAGGGAPLHKIDGSRAASGDLWRKCFHYVGFRLDAGRIQAQVVTERGEVLPELAFPLCSH